MTDRVDTKTNDHLGQQQQQVWFCYGKTTIVARLSYLSMIQVCYSNNRFWCKGRFWSLNGPIQCRVLSNLQIYIYTLSMQIRPIVLLAMCCQCHYRHQCWQQSILIVKSFTTKGKLLLLTTTWKKEREHKMNHKQRSCILTNTKTDNRFGHVNDLHWRRMKTNWVP